MKKIVSRIENFQLKTILDTPESFRDCSVPKAFGTTQKTLEMTIFIIASNE
ncbi:MAG: hypothetical protein H7250_11095 [Flavobacterium sp.]|nr:hypothetical protein [Flavobacterium sp.]